MTNPSDTNVAFVIGHRFDRNSIQRLWIREALSPVFTARTAHAVELCKQFIGPLLAGCRVYHHTGTLHLLERAPRCILAYAAPDRSRAVIGVFRTAGMGGECASTCPGGPGLSRSYLVTFENLGESVGFAGTEITRNRLRIRLPANLTS